MIRSVMRVGMCLAALGAAISLTACGKASLSAQAIAEARAVTLRANDIPGFHAGQRARFRAFTAGPLRSKVERCDGGMPGPRGIAAVRGQWLFGTAGSHLVSVHSAVYVFTSEAAALREVAVLRSPRARACIERVERGGNLASGAFRRLRAVALPADLGPRSVGLRVVGERIEPGVHERFVTFTDSRGFALGRVIVMAYTQGLGAPAPAALEQHALSLLDSRARAREL